MTPTAVVAGASIAGLATALSLSELGYRVEVLDPGAEPPEGPAPHVAGEWERATVPQARHSHSLTSLGVRVLRDRAPRVLAGAQAAGATLLDLVAALPPGVDDRTPELGDDELVALACRRSTFELVLHRAVRERPGVAIRHGTAVRGLLLDRTGTRVAAAVTRDGGRLPADVVVDATGRRAASRRWLAAAGVPVADDLSSPAGLRGFTRFYRLTGRIFRPDEGVHRLPGPLNRGNGAGDIWDHYAGVLHPGDADTFSVALAVLPNDPVMDALRHPAAFTAVARATPGLTAWLADGVAEPISPVQAITSPPNALRGTATSRQRPVAGLFPVGDAACVTNPLFGRGISLALAHAFRLADLLATGDGASPETGRAAARAAEELYLPWYEQSVRADRERIGRWTAAVAGHAPPAAPPDGTDPDGTAQPTLQQAAAAARTDATVWRGVIRVLMGLKTPAEVFGDEKFAARVRQAPAPDADPRRHAPTRTELVRTVAAAEGR